MRARSTLGVREDMLKAVAEAQAETGGPSPDIGKVGKALPVVKDLDMRGCGGLIARGIVSGEQALVGRRRRRWGPSGR